MTLSCNFFRNEEQQTHKPWNKPFTSWIVGLSGLLMLVCQVDAYEIYSAKKGIGAGDLGKIQALKPSWYYNWNIQRVAGVDPAIEYVPMRHNKWWRNESELANIGEFDYFLGFNEPERSDQGNISVPDAIARWPDLEAAVTAYGNPGAQMGSPATANPQHAWIIDFMNQAEAGGLQVDFMAMHKYPTPGSSDSIMNGAQWYHDTYGRDVWITEFNAADWSAPNNYTHEQSYTWMAEVLFRLESTSYITRYAIFPWNGTTSASQASGVFRVDEQQNVTYSLTPLGKLYREYHEDDIYGPYDRIWYHLHNRGSRMRLHDDGGIPSAANIYREGAPVEFELVPAGGGNVYIVNRGTGERLGSDGTMAYWAASETGSSVQWSLSTNLYNWLHIAHVGSGNYLYGQNTGEIGLSASAADDTYRWAFIRSGTAYGASGNTAPVFTVDPISTPNAVEDAAYSSTVAGSATDTDGDPLVYSLIEGPAWLQIAPDGLLYGTPGILDTGPNTWTLQVSDGIDTDTVELKITVDGVSSNVLTIVGATFGAEQVQNPAVNSYDGDAATRWSNDGTLANAWIEYDLGSSFEIDQVELLLYNGSARTYPIRIEIDGVPVFTGSTTMSASFWSVNFTPTTGRYVTIAMTGANSDGSNWLSIYESIIMGTAVELPAPGLDISMSGDIVTISWPADYTGWSLGYKTNLISTNGWIALPGSELTNRVNAGPMTNDSLFFRLMSP